MEHTRHKNTLFSPRDTMILESFVANPVREISAITIWEPARMPHISTMLLLPFRQVLKQIFPVERRVDLTFLESNAKHTT